MWGKNYVPDELMLLFTDDDLFVDQEKVNAFVRHEQRRALDLEADEDRASWDTRLMGYSASAGTLRARLAIQGFSSEWVRELSGAFFDESGEGDDLFQTWPEGRSIYPNGAAITAALATRRGQDAGAGIEFKLRGHHDKSFLHEQWQSIREAFDDPRFALSLCLSRTRASTTVTLDLSDLVFEGWLTVDERPHRDARSRMSTAVAASGPVIVVTEGTSDARWLRRSLEMASPEVAHFFEFLDFAGFKSPGGTDRVVSLTKGMAAAGVMNRIVAVLDNDTAGREAAQELARLNLPSRIVVASLPTVEYANQYPTIGTEGPSTANVNGRAASIEFMFGEDVLRDSDGSLFPVRWHSFNEKVGAYQGRLENRCKLEVGQRIDQALSDAGTDPIADEVLEGCRRLSAMLLLASGQPRNVPASESSVLSAMWRSDPFCAIEIET